MPREKVQIMPFIESPDKGPQNGDLDPEMVTDAICLPVKTCLWLIFLNSINYNLGMDEICL